MLRQANRHHALAVEGASSPDAGLALEIELMQVMLAECNGCSSRRTAAQVPATDMRVSWTGGSDGEPVEADDAAHVAASEGAPPLAATRAEPPRRRYAARSSLLRNTLGPYGLAAGIAAASCLVAAAVARAFDLRLRQPDGIAGPAYVRLPGVFALFVLSDVLSRFVLARRSP